jgi:dTDP-glucose pyrophosphorylase
MITSEKFLILENMTILDALKQIEAVSDDIIRTLFVCDDKNRVLGTLTEGDCRRGLIKGMPLVTEVSKVMNKDFTYLSTVEYKVENIEYIRKQGFNFVPLLNQDKTINKIIDFSKGKSYIPVDAVFMAGGKGERLRPLTLTTPKPLLKIADKPIIDYNIDILIKNSVEHINIIVNYLAEQIINHYKNPIKNNVIIKCIKEFSFLGTIGSITYVDKWYNDTILLMNSDLFTNINMEAFYLHFLKNNADMSVATIPYSVNVPYGIFDLEGTRNIIGIREKPSYHYYANAGIYLFKRKLLELIPQSTSFNATDLIEKLINNKYKVIRYPISGYWIDIGNPEDYNKAQELAQHLNNFNER